MLKTDLKLQIKLVLQKKIYKTHQGHFGKLCLIRGVLNNRRI